ncbi:MAG: hypothetical protein U1G07_05640 [Verrucomicrobiota bacterium]
MPKPTFPSDATGAHWRRASAESRHSFVTAACRLCAAGGQGESTAWVVVEGIDAFFKFPRLRHKKVAFAFGEVYAALLAFGHYYEHLERIAAVQ